MSDDVDLLAWLLLALLMLGAFVAGYRVGYRVAWGVDAAIPPWASRLVVRWRAKAREREATPARARACSLDLRDCANELLDAARPRKP